MGRCITSAEYVWGELEDAFMHEKLLLCNLPSRTVDHHMHGKHAWPR